MSQTLLVQDVETALFSAFPRADAFPWDRVGLSVGDPCDEVKGISFALDPTVDTIMRAQEVGANVLVTHHPVALELPMSIMSTESGGFHPGDAMWAAVAHGISLIAMHTNLDRSPRAAELWHKLFGGTYLGALEHDETAPSTGRLGQIIELETAQDITLFVKELEEKFGKPPRVYGDKHQNILRIAVASGSCGDMWKRALEYQADALITGECGYHAAFECQKRGCSVIVLGHDVSERPYSSLLRDTLIQQGISETYVKEIAEPYRWWTI